MRNRLSSFSLSCRGIALQQTEPIVVIQIHISVNIKSHLHLPAPHCISDDNPLRPVITRYPIAVSACASYCQWTSSAPAKSADRAGSAQVLPAFLHPERASHWEPGGSWFCQFVDTRLRPC